ncbi:unnamed protein product, partial [Timema podura]|nr:unnamed protein product [Timema podura]
MSSLYKAPERFLQVYFSKFPGYYDTMDAGYRDDFGYIYVTARDDDVINVAGHRLSTAALEDVVMSHPDIGDAAVIGVPESTKGEIPLCLFIMKKVIESSKKGRPNSFDHKGRIEPEVEPGFLTGLRGEEVEPGFLWVEQGTAEIFVRGGGACGQDFREGARKSEKAISHELVSMVRELIGPIAAFRHSAAVSGLPRTRSGKIARKSIADLARSKPVK